MKHVLSLSLAALLLAGAGILSTAAATEFFVATNGDDANPGTKAKPFATLQRARDEVRSLKTHNDPSAVRNGATVFLRGGTYWITKPIVFTPQDSGTKECPVVYAAYRNEKPVLCGGKKIVGFKPAGDGKLAVVLPEVKAGAWSFRSLFVDGERQIRARYPNFDSTDPCRKGFLYVASNPGG